MNRNLWLLAICQGLFLTNNVTFIAINGLVGLNLAPLGWMATLPVMGYVVGGSPVITTPTRSSTDLPPPNWRSLRFAKRQSRWSWPVDCWVPWPGPT